MSCISPRALAGLSSMSVGVESEWGVASTTPAFYFDVVSETLNERQERIEKQHFIGDAVYATRGYSAGRNLVSGEIRGEFQPHGFWPLALWHALGVKSTSGSGPTYTHTIYGGAAKSQYQQGLSIQRDLGFRGGSFDRRRYVGSRISELGFNIQPDRAITATAQIQCKSVSEVGATLTTPYRFRENAAWLGNQATFQGTLLGDLSPVPIVIQSISFTIRTGLLTDQFTIEGGRDRAMLDYGRREITGRFRAFLNQDNLAILSRYEGNNTGRITLQLSRPSGSDSTSGPGGSSFTCLFLFPSIVMAGEPAPNIDRGGGQFMDFTFKALAASIPPTTDLLVQIVNEQPLLDDSTGAQPARAPAYVDGTDGFITGIHRLNFDRALDTTIAIPDGSFIRQVTPTDYASYKNITYNGASQVVFTDSDTIAGVTGNPIGDLYYVAPPGTIAGLNGAVTASFGPIETTEIAE